MIEGNAQSREGQGAGAAEEAVVRGYADVLTAVVGACDWAGILALADRIWGTWRSGGSVFLCGNGGSAASALHLANDLVYGVAPSGRGVRAECLSANASVVTCLANDTGYENVFALQLRTKANAGDGLIVFSGSGNSPNILEALDEARRLGLWTCGMLGYSGGKAFKSVDLPIHFKVDDMEIAEDLQMVVGHMVKRILKKRVQQEGGS